MSKFLPSDSYRKLPGTGRLIGGHPINSGCQLCMVNSESIGTVSHDLTLGANNGTINNGSWGPGKFGNTVRYNGSSTYIQIADVAALRLTTFTLSAWVRPTSTEFSNSGFVFHKAASATGGADRRNYTLYLSSTGKITFQFTVGSSQYKQVNGNTSLVAGVWYHVAGTFDGATSTVYLNGVFDGSAALAFTPDNDGTNPVYLGRYNSGADSAPSNYFDGSADLQRIWNRALYAYEVRQLFERPFIGIDGILGHNMLDLGGLDALAAAAGLIKTRNGLAWASVKSVDGLAAASIKTINGLAAN